MTLKSGAESMAATAKNLIDPVIQKTGENISLGKVFEVSGGTLGSYVHNDKIAVIVSLEGGNAELAKDIAMHIAAMKPEYLAPEEISEEAKKLVWEIFQKEVAGINKPEDVKKKMLEGKMAAYFKEKTLTDQPFIKDGNETIGSLLAKNNAKIKEVARYSI
jgi:elongation factor Ts